MHGIRPCAAGALREAGKMDRQMRDRFEHGAEAGAGGALAGAAVGAVAGASGAMVGAVLGAAAGALAGLVIQDNAVMRGPRGRGR